MSTANIRGWRLTSGCSTKRLTEPIRCWSGASFCRYFIPTSTIFYGARRSLLNDAKAHPDATENKTDLTAREQTDGILRLAKGYYRAADAVYCKLKSELAKNGLRIRTGAELSQKQYAKCKRHFETQVLPLLSPMVLDAKHPMIRFESMNCYMLFELTKADRPMYGVMAISPKLPRVYRIDGGKK